MKKLIAILLFLAASQVQAQKIRGGIYLGTGFATQKSDYNDVSVLPIDKGGFNFHYGVHLNFGITKRFEIETGIQKVTKGFNYSPQDPNTGIIISEYTKVTTLSVPVMAVYHLINYPDEMPFRASIGVGAYGSYAATGKIKYDDGTSQKAHFSNSRRQEFGPRVMIKAEFAHKIETYIATDIASTNIVRNGSGYIRQGSIQIGLGWILFGGGNN